MQYGKGEGGGEAAAALVTSIFNIRNEFGKRC